MGVVRCSQVHTLESTGWEAELHSCINDQDITLDETSQDFPEPSVPSDKDVISAIEVLKLYAIHNPSVLDRAYNPGHIF